VIELRTVVDERQAAKQVSNNITLTPLQVLHKLSRSTGCTVKKTIPRKNIADFSLNLHGLQRRIQANFIKTFGSIQKL